jgi:hypothetical protein
MGASTGRRLFFMMNDPRSEHFSQKSTFRADIPPAIIAADSGKLYPEEAMSPERPCGPAEADYEHTILDH